ncbi:hypothetical protein [Amycolatopsis sp. EV170708-02-1]|uniref:hypothetical protein n=1 Tax=Amycolatopsis sp. EV170708-02-1 TaxID=2919322 RepID=UPI001F0C8382|nr:hypothetical protein [Amycolatopsis sp. EV170708-02-1]UMP07000.1 hypothetical protein MJQ72_20265 [Amycolatopsis sp. EV170708-02-1]
MPRLLKNHSPSTTKVVEEHMNKNVDLSALQDVFSDFRRNESKVLPAYHSPHGDAEAWRLAEDTRTGNSISES